MNPDLSIIIPVYNSGKYLHECINSVLCQTYDNFELILVNDGSSDGSGEICDDYSSKYPGKVITIHKPNGGAASARNKGLSAARGKYIGFVDSDDTILKDMFSFMVSELKNSGADVIETRFITDIKKDPASLTNESTIISAREAFIEMMNWRLSTSLCTKFFRRGALKGLLLDEGHINEDFRLLCEVFLKDLKVCISSNAFYKYRETAGSVTRCLRPNFFDIFRNLDYIRTILPPDDKELQRQLNFYALTMHIMSGVKIVRANLNTTFKLWLRKNRAFIIKNWRLLLFSRSLSFRWRAKAAFAFMHLPRKI